MMMMTSEPEADVHPHAHVHALALTRDEDPTDTIGVEQDDTDNESAHGSAGTEGAPSPSYVECADGVDALYGLERRAQSSAKLFSASSSMVTAATTSSLATSERASAAATAVAHLPASYSYSVPSSAHAPPRDRPAVDVIATYMNTCENRSAKADLLRSQGHFPSPRNGQSRIRSSSMMSKDSSAEWGWFADIDSSSESWGGDGGSLGHLRRKLSADLGVTDAGNALHVLGDEQTNTRITAAHKTFNITMDGMSKVVSATISIPKFRIVQSRAGADRHAQYLIMLKLGKEVYADWRRYSEFGELMKKLDVDRYGRSNAAWKEIDTRWFNRLEPSYLHQKCITLENFMRELMYESNEPVLLIEFLGGYMGKVNARPTDPAAYRPSAQLPKELRPPQPKHERELFEKMWAENFKRSRVDYSGVPTDSA